MTWKIHGKLLVMVCSIAALAVVAYAVSSMRSREYIKVGILHSQTGTLAHNEQPLIDVMLMAIDEINKKGGVLGKLINPIIVDGKSSEQAFAQGAQELIEKHKVVVIFGCWSSSSRKAIKSIIEKHKTLLMYPVQNEGLEESPYILYTGSLPNQSVIPATTWCFENIGKRFFLVGSDFVSSRAYNEVIKYHIAALGGEVVAEEYIPLGGKKVAEIIKKIVDTKPAVILSTINGDTNNYFFSALREAGVEPATIPTMSFRISEPELQSFNIQSLVGDYIAGTYFQSIYRPENNKFVENYKKRYGVSRVTSSNIETAYDNVYLWAQGVEEAGTTLPDTAIPYIKKQIFNGPGSIIYLDAKSNRAWKMVYVGKIQFNDRQLEVVWSSEKQIAPLVYPPYKTKEYWQEFLSNLYNMWGNSWGVYERT